jgi:membrane protein required for colicin V production
LTLFDLIAIAILAISGLIGFTRGAVRELITVFAFTLAALAAIYLMPVAGPISRRMVHPTWAANAAAVVTVFVVAYVALRVCGSWITSRLHEQVALGAIDRSIGLCFGVLRALVFLGVFYLVFNMATPPELVPKWISEGTLYPVARAAGKIVGAVAPRALKASSHIGPALERAVTETGEDDNAGAAVLSPAPAAPALTVPDRPPAAQPQSEKAPRKVPTYDKRSRDDIDALVERSR